MNPFRSQKGYALVLVLIVITVFSLLFLMLSGMTLNNAKQIVHTEDDIQATSLAEMGVVNYNTLILTILKKVVEDPETFNKISDQFNTWLNANNYDEVTDANKEIIVNKLKEIVTNIWTEEMGEPTLDENPMVIALFLILRLVRLK